MTAGRPIHQNNKTVRYFYTVSKLQILQTYKRVHLNKHFKEKLTVTIQLGERTPSETKSLFFHNLSKTHRVSCTGCKLQPEGWLFSEGSSSARKTQHHPNSSGAIHSWIKYNTLWCKQNRSLTPPSTKTFYTMRNKEYVGGTCNMLPW